MGDDTEQKSMPSRKRGRPPSDDPTTPVRTRLPNSSYDKVAQLALEHGISMSAAIRRIVVFRLRDL